MLLAGGIDEYTSGKIVLGQSFPVSGFFAPLFLDSKRFRDSSWLGRSITSLSHNSHIASLVQAARCRKSALKEKETALLECLE